MHGKVYEITVAQKPRTVLGANVSYNKRRILAKEQIHLKHNSKDSTVLIQEALSVGQEYG